jgi:hypothetical protein
VPHVVTTGGAPWSAYFGWVIPAPAGDITGGAALVAALGHAQVVSGKGGGL